MTIIFREFLKDAGAYEKYMKNSKGESADDFDGFSWSETKEGYGYWNKLDALWYEASDLRAKCKLVEQAFKDFKGNKLDSLWYEVSNLKAKGKILEQKLKDFKAEAEIKRINYESISILT